MFSRPVETAAPVEVALRPVLASRLVCWLRAVSAAICAELLAAAFALGADGFAGLPVTVPARALVPCVPLTGPPVVLT